MIYDRHPNKDKCDALGGIIIIRREFMKVTIREQLCIIIRHKDFRDHKLQYTKKWVRVIREGCEAHTFKYSEYKEERGEVAVKSDARETTIHATTQENINALLADG